MLKIDNALRAAGFSRFPLTREPFTFRQGARKSTIDYIFTRGLKIVAEVVTQVFITNHRPLRITFQDTIPATSTQLQSALGRAYPRSATALAKLESDISQLALMKVFKLYNIILLLSHYVCFLTCFSRTTFCH